MKSMGANKRAPKEKAVIHDESVRDVDRLLSLEKRAMVDERQ